VPGGIELVGPRLTLRTTVPDDATALREIRATAGVRRWWGEPEDGFPIEVEPDVTRLTVESSGEVAGMLQWSESDDPAYRSAGLDLFIAPARQRRGLGTAAMRLAAEHLTGDRGHHRLTVDPAAANRDAIGFYRSLGYRTVGLTRRSERDDLTGEWRDQLLMELVTGPGGADVVAEREGYAISTDPSRLDREIVWGFLTESYWARGIPRETLEQAIDASLSFGVYAPDGSQAGYARVVTDRATFAWIGDLFVLEPHRGRGLGVWLTATILAHPAVNGLRKVVLATADAHDLYARFGFERADPERMMEISRPPEVAYPATRDSP
jgi:RimJ/RimL family protein N-acetyltransferase